MYILSCTHQHWQKKNGVVLATFEHNTLKWGSVDSCILLVWEGKIGEPEQCRPPSLPPPSSTQLLNIYTAVLRASDRYGRGVTEFIRKMKHTSFGEITDPQLITLLTSLPSLPPATHTHTQRISPHVGGWGCGTSDMLIWLIQLAN